MAKQQDTGHVRGVFYQGSMRIAWEPRSEETSIHPIDADESNVRLLRAVLLSQDSHRDMGDELGEKPGDLVRVEAKLDLLLDMVSQLLGQGRQQAIEVPVELWLEGLSWCTSASNLPGVGQLLWLYLYIDSRLAQPLKLPVSVTALESTAGNAAVTVAFDLLEEPVEDLLGKLIFRQHRRMIAQRKANERSHQGD